MKKINIFRISESLEDNGIGAAYVRNYSDTFYFPAFELAPPPPFHDFDLKDGGFGDFVSGDTVPLYSAKFKSLLEKLKGPKDQLQWFPVRLHASLETRDYFILHIVHAKNILDNEKTKFATPEMVAIPAFMNLHGRNIFCHEHLVTDTLFVRADVKTKIEKAGIDGLRFASTNGGIVDEN